MHAYVCAFGWRRGLYFAVFEMVNNDSRTLQCIEFCSGEKYANFGLYGQPWRCSQWCSLCAVPCLQSGHGDKLGTCPYLSQLCKSAWSKWVSNHPKPINVHLITCIFVLICSTAKVPSLCNPINNLYYPISFFPPLPGQCYATRASPRTL